MAGFAEAIFAEAELDCTCAGSRRRGARTACVPPGVLRLSEKGAPQLPDWREGLRGRGHPRRRGPANSLGWLVTADDVDPRGGARRLGCHLRDRALAVMVARRPRVQKLEGGDGDGVGSLYRHEWRSVIPYPVRFETRITKIELPHLIEAEADGELAGMGRWRFDDRETAVTYEWDVRTTRAWMNLAALWRGRSSAGTTTVADAPGGEAGQIAGRALLAVGVACRPDARPRHRRRRLHRLPLRQAAQGCGRGRPRARQAHLLGQPGEPGRDRDRASRRRHLRCARRSPRRPPAATRSSTSPPRRTSTARSSGPPSSSRRTSPAPRCCSITPASIRLVHVSTDEVYGDVAEGVSSVEDDPCGRRARTRPPRPAAICRCSAPCAPTASTR